MCEDRRGRVSPPACSVIEPIDPCRLRSSVVGTTRRARHRLLMGGVYTPASSRRLHGSVQESLAPARAEAGALVWWAGVATVLPRGSLVPPTGSRWLRRWNELRLDELPLLSSRRPVFRYPHIAPGEARRLAKPTCTGLGDLLSSWLMPMTL